MDTVLFKLICSLFFALPVVVVLRAAWFHWSQNSVMSQLFFADGLVVLILEAFVIWIAEAPDMGGLLLFLIPAILACFFVLSYIYLQEHLLRNDGLTGAGSRMYFECRLSEILRKNNGEPFGMIYLDVDNLKDINDRFGHGAGDETLKALVSVIKSVLRRIDTISRLGGDEFGILVYVENDADLKTVARKIERALEAYNQTSGKPYKIACSMGVKLFWKSPGLNVETVLSLADELMYCCKKRKQNLSMPPWGGG